MQYHVINLESGEDWYADGTDPLDERYPNLLVKEFACKDGTMVVPYHPWVAMVFQALRNIYGAMIPSSGYRTWQHNKNEGGAKDSRHLYGQAMDLHVPDGVDVEHFYRTAQEIGGRENGYIIYHNRIHFDCRGYRYVEDKR